MLSDSISDRTLALLFLYNKFPIKFCITTMHMNYSLFVLHLIYGISDRTLSLLFLYDNSLQNFASPQSIWIFHSSLFVFHLHMYSIYNKKYLVDS